MKRVLLLLITVVVLISCKGKQKTGEEVQETPQLSMVKAHRLKNDLDAFSKTQLKEWKEYHALHDFLQGFTKISPNEAMSKALDLKDLVKQLKDSAKPKTLDINSFKVRVNVLENETLRLADMTYIPAMKAPEINDQVTKVLDVFSAVNSKINTVYAQQRFEESIDSDKFFVGLDTTKIDSVSKKRLRKEENEIAPNKN